MRKILEKEITGYLRKDIEGIVIRCINCLNNILIMWYPIYIGEEFIFTCIKCKKEYIYKVKEIIGGKITFEVTRKIKN